MNDKNHHSESWDYCPKGALVQAVAELKARRRSRILALSIGPVTVVLSVLLVGVMLAQRGSTTAEKHYGGISCSRVRELLVDYRQGKLEVSLASSIGVHLNKCRMCRTSYESIHGEEDPVLQVLHLHECGSCQQDDSQLIVEKKTSLPSSNYAGLAWFGYSKDP